MKIDMKNEREKSYKNGWFGTTIKEKKINKLSDICDWIEDMRELAEKGWKRQLWGAKKKDDRGMLGILKVCNDNDFDKLKKLPHGIFDCVNLKKLLDKINECVGKTSRGRTKQPGFSKSLENCMDFLDQKMRNIRNAGNYLETFADRLKVPKENNVAMYNLGSCIYGFGDPKTTSNINVYKTFAGLTNGFFETIINSKKIEVGVNPRTGNWLELAKEKIDYLYTNKNYWIIKEILGDYLAKALENNCKKIFEDLTNKTIKLEQIKKNDKDDDDDDE